MAQAPARIETEADLAAGAAVLVARAPCFAPVLAAVGPLPLRRRPDGFPALLSAIVGQQVSTASAAAILGRLEAAGLAEEGAAAAASEEALRACGLSRPKIRYVRALAAARLDYGALRAADTETVVATLTALPGIGRWTAEIYAKFALGHADAFAAGDLALQVAAARAFDLPARPSEPALREMAAAWSPVRAVAARALWAYYRLDTGREGSL
ncbi:DNA-3-methyladenine glycosylase family protein [Roseicyclus persicicus]|uniref:DNA-3-methyladenine glycosylase II n=1 Tax=Roseicyclus persicicus TaxID=2650661 RepID=A0A7X6H2H5_9RHOB|nr:DNA-3-methyladenine glycosylase 2 family protein [Roseibacterium persicicum]NKX46159.1 DNA-3-methyladenine glycosylase 2 family protein [Roseibacterium persicicum]